MQIKFYQPKSLTDLQFAVQSSQQDQLVFYQAPMNLAQICSQQNQTYAVICLGDVAEFKQIRQWEFGSQVTITQLMSHFNQMKTQPAETVAQTLLMFRNTSLRNVETIGILNPEMICLLMALEAKAVVYDVKTQKQFEVVVNDELKLGESQLLVKITAHEPQFLHVEKRARRHQNAEAVEETVLSLKNE